MQEKICCVTYGELDQLVRQVVDSYKDETCCFDIVEGVREENLDRINRSILEGAEIIIAGGANAEVIRGYFKVPVINYKVTFLDYMQAVQTGFREGKKVCLVSYMTHMNSRLREYLEQIQRPVMEIIYEDTEELEEKIRQSEADVFVGNGLAVQLANSLGRKGVILYYGKDSIEESIEEARRLLREIRRDKERNQFVKAMMEYSPNGVLYLDTENRIIDCNRTVYELLHKPSGILEGKIIEDVLPECVPENREGPESMVVQVDNRTYIERWIPVDDGNGTCFGYIIILALFSDYKKAELDYRNKQSEQRKKRGFTAKFTLSDIIGDSYHMKMAKDEAKLFARSDASVLIYGETGVGKELFAQSIHNGSLRKNGAFVAVNCAALPENLLESELFGYDEGAFTGGRKGGKKGLFELAEGGSLFLDEIGELDLDLQTKLLQVVQEHSMRSIGSTEYTSVNIRVIAATNRSLPGMIKAGQFRLDLYYRLNVVSFEIPPLSRRRQDIRALIEYLSLRFGQVYGCQKTFTPEAMGFLLDQEWLGNIREIQNFMEKLYVLEDASVITDTLLKENYRFSRSPAPQTSQAPEFKPLKQAVAEFQKTYITEVRRHTRDLDEAAQILGMDRAALNHRLKDI